MPPERDDSSSNYHRSASMIVERPRPILDHCATLTPITKSSSMIKSSKDLELYGTVKLRKNASMCEKKQRNSSIDMTDTNFLRYEDVAAMMSGRETIRRHYTNAVKKYEDLKEDYDYLHSRYSDLVNAHSSAVFKLELTQDDLDRMRKNCEELAQEKNAANRDRNGLQQQCTAAIRQWDKALRECNEAKDLLAKVQQQRDDAMKEVNQAMTWRIKSAKDLARLTEERNSAVKEYSLIMSERDQVHKEIEKLQEDLHEAQKRVKILEEDKQVNLIQIDSLKKEVLASGLEKQRLMKECAELREKVCDFSDETASPPTTSRSSISLTSGLRLWGSSSSVVLRSYRPNSNKK